MANTAPIFLVRGAPGAGKSTFAEKIRGLRNAFIFETDNFFLDSVNRHDYHFDPKLLGVAHSWNQGEVIRACRDCPTVPVIVANTFAEFRELEPYLEIARQFGRKVFIFTLLTEHDNVHSVPDKTVLKKREQIQNTVNGAMGEAFAGLCFNKYYTVVYMGVAKTDEEADKISLLAHAKCFG